jgi:hypothetical protein
MRDRRIRTLSSTVALVCCLLAKQLFAQDQLSDRSTTGIYGTVISRVTHEPIGRALVYSGDNRYGVLTDSEGHFELALPSSERANMLMARKPGFLPTSSQLANGNASARELTISLTPEALIVGRVSLPSSDYPEGIQVQLYSRQVQQGRARWVPSARVRSRSNGEFRFADLAEGNYRVFTLERMDRDPLTFDPHGQMYGYPPAYFPSASDFGSAETIRLSAGQIFQANIALLKRSYYPVKVPVTNVPAGSAVNVLVSPQGHNGPGYSLGYNGGRQMIEGMLPDGNYSLEGTLFGSGNRVHSATGLVNISVNGGPVQGPGMVMVADAAIPIKINEEFTHPGSAPPDAVGFFPRRFHVANPNIELVLAEEIAERLAVPLLNPAGSDDDSLRMANVPPGRYWVNVTSARGYAASIICGGQNLQNQPLAVLAGGSMPPIEIAMRDDWAEIEGTVEGVSQPAVEKKEAGSLFGGKTSGSWNTAFSPHIYLVPLPDAAGEFREISASADGTFRTQIPPGTYRVLAFDREQPDLEYRNPEAMRAYESRGQIVNLGPGGKEHVRVQLVSASD